MKMDLEETIKYHKEKAEELRKQYELYDHWDEEEEERANCCLACAAEHEQLAKWLEELVELRKIQQKGEIKMRSIDAEALKKAVDTWDKFGYTAQGELIRLTEKNKDLYVPYVKYQDIVNCINNAPTVEERMFYVQETVNTILNSCTGNTDIDKAFRNAARLIQNAIDGKSVDFEEIERSDEE